MNPLTNVRNIKRLGEIELTRIDKKGSWHDDYTDSAYIYIGSLSYELTEGDILAVFSQYGEIVSINLVKDKQTDKSRGYCFLCYADQRSTILAVDNLNGIKLCGRTIRVDHVKDYKQSKDGEGIEVGEIDCAPKTPPPSDEMDSGSSYDSNEWIAAPRKKKVKTNQEEGIKAKHKHTHKTKAN
ncbi:RNA-binding motif protein, X-linked 2 [Oopsacas minuta]|uniref:RNA-binding motif protein, X-linked 2 n=1 Tax=Oopsacas minuta TaxID=111878 RepID=A0AAV7K756_9METZ|nr:RNA-binding motif protein, X-linked 2 [Oopsacas minuta]